MTELEEMIECVKREVRPRYAVYPRFIASGKMTAERAEKEKKLMYKVQCFLQEVQRGKQPQNIQLQLL